VEEINYCPVCEDSVICFLYAGHTGRRPDDPGTWKVCRCSLCGHAFINPRPTWRELTAYYADDYEPYQANHGATAADDDSAVALAERTGQFRHLPLPSGKRLLDVGCGGGWFLRVAKRLGATVQGVEPSAAGAHSATLSGIDVYHGDLEKYASGPGRNQRFDIITANHVLEHTSNPVETLRTMRTLLEVDGIVWIAIPNPTGYFGRKLREAWHSVDLPYHLQQFCPKSIALAGERAGLVMQRRYTSSLPESVAASLRMLWRRRYMLPRKLTHKITIIDRYYAPRLAAALDRVNDGEALVTEFRLPNRKELTFSSDSGRGSEEQPLKPC
jgi:SAM-dependent methyltransferase